MRLSACRPVLTVLILALPAGLVVTATPAIAQHACVAAVVIWLAALGWGFHAMLHHRLAAEDRLAELESAMAMERDAYQAARVSARHRAVALEAEWQRLAACLTADDRHHVPERMHAVEAAIVSLHETA